jgi:hypothetical protein
MSLARCIRWNRSATRAASGSASHTAGAGGVDEPGVDDEPAGTAMCRSLGHASLPLGDRAAQLGAQPARQPRACPNRGHRLGEGTPGTQLLHAAPAPLVPDETHSRGAIGDIPRPGAHQRPLSETGNTPQLRQADAAWPAVTTWATRPPNASNSTQSTARPSRPNRREASDTESLPPCLTGSSHLTGQLGGGD